MRSTSSASSSSASRETASIENFSSSRRHRLLLPVRACSAHLPQSVNVILAIGPNNMLFDLHLPLGVEWLHSETDPTLPCTRTRTRTLELHALLSVVLDLHLSCHATPLAAPRCASAARSTSSRGASRTYSHHTKPVTTLSKLSEHITRTSVSDCQPQAHLCSSGCPLRVRFCLQADPAQCSRPHSAEPVSSVWGFLDTRRPCSLCFFGRWPCPERCFRRVT